MLASLLEIINNIYDAGWVPRRIKQHFFQYTFNIIVSLGLIYGYIYIRSQDYVKRVENEGIESKKLARLCNNGDDMGDKCYVSLAEPEGASLEKVLRLADYQEKKYIKIKFYKITTARVVYNKFRNRADLTYPDLIHDENQFGIEKYKNTPFIDREKLNRMLLVSSETEQCGSFSSELLIKMELHSMYQFLLSLNADIGTVTYCYDDDKITVLTQVKGHPSVKKEGSRFGCKTPDCLQEVVDAHEELKKISQEFPF
jgi:hypothetical protein